MGETLVWSRESSVEWRTACERYKVRKQCEAFYAFENNGAQWDRIDVLQPAGNRETAQATCQAHLDQRSDPVCPECNDSHKMWHPDYEDKVMCTHCPTPCEDCGGGGPCGVYCAETPCSCACHNKYDEPC